jgi:hypothetical protein
MRRTWTIIGVGDVPRSFRWYQSLLGLPETAPAMTTSVRSSTPMERSCSAFTSGCTRASLLDEPRSRTAWQWPSLVLSASIISKRRCHGHALSSPGSKRSPT